MKQLTVRGIDRGLERRLRELARERRVSLNRAALILLREGAGLESPRAPANVVEDSLDSLIGSWSKKDEVEFLNAIAPLEKVGPSLYR